MTINEIIKAVMVRRNETQKSLAEKLGITQQGVSRLLKAGGNMRIDSLVTLMEAFGCEVIIKFDDEEIKLTKAVQAE